MTRSRRPLVVIGHQSAIPHYRVSFYQKLKLIAGNDWDFGVLFDPSQQERNSSFCEELHIDQFDFRTMPTSTRYWNLGRQQFIWQPMRRHIKDAALIITDTHLSNISYPWYALTRSRGCRWALWGHSSDRNLPAAQKARFIKRMASQIKRRYIAQADSFFAYTEGERKILLESGYCSNKVHVIDNTIDLQQQREIALSQLPKRAEIRLDLNFQKDEKIFLMVGRLLPGRRVEFLLETFDRLARLNPKIRLVIIGGGAIPDSLKQDKQNQVTWLGPISDLRKLGNYLTAADALIVPGAVGLGILQPLAHELPVIAFDLETHGPEIEYLGPVNSVLLPRETTPNEFADFINHWSTAEHSRGDESRYQSIAHLTLENMAQKFDHAVRQTLNLT